MEKEEFLRRGPYCRSRLLLVFGNNMFPVGYPNDGDV